MADSESPKTVFEFVFTRKEDPPVIISYDNVCNLQPYSLNREPEWFHKVLFYVNEFHFRGHKNCSCEFSSANCHKLESRNYSLAEQKNRILRSMESSVGYMSRVNFLLFLSFFVHKMNKVERGRRVLDVEEHDLEEEV